jgi:hypothetical protein
LDHLHQAAGVLFGTGKGNVVGQTETAVGDNDGQETSTKKYFVGTSSLSYRRDGMEIQTPLTKGLGIKNHHLICSFDSPSISSMKALTLIFFVSF